MSELFADKYKYSTLDTDAFVATANRHIDETYEAGRQVGDAFFHSVAVFLSKLNIEQKNGGPFGAVIVKYEGGLDENGKGIGKPQVIGVGANHVVPQNDPSAHAEMEAYRDAAKRQGFSDLKDSVLYASCECCPMCLSGGNGCGVGRISYVNTRSQAEGIDFSDKLQYDMFLLPRDAQMTHAESLPEARKAELTAKLGAHGAVVLDADGNVFAVGDTDTQLDPTNVASLSAIRAAVKKHAAEMAAAGNTDPVFCVPDNFTLVTREIPHPVGLITADWARMLRERDDANPDNPAFDSKTPQPDRVVYLNSTLEQMPVIDRDGKTHIRQDAAITYEQPTLPDAERAVPTENYTGRVVASAAADVFDSWKRGITSGAQTRY